MQNYSITSILYIYQFFRGSGGGIITFIIVDKKFVSTIEV